MEDKQYRSGGIEMLEMLEATDEYYKTCDIINGRPCIPCQRTIEMDAQIATAANAIGDTQDVLSRLLKDKHALRAERNQFHDPIVRRLPTELISSIFEACVNNREPSSVLWELSLSPQNLYTVSPLVLGSVCQIWNRIAWTLPTLWTHVCIRTHGWEKSIYIERLERWLQRSGSLPLCILTAIPANFATPENPGIVGLINVIKRHASRWQSLYVFCHHSLDLGLLFGDIISAPYLRNLFIRRDQRRWNDNAEHTTTCTRLSPSSLKLKNVSLREINVGWSDITDVDIVGFIRSNDCEEILRKSPGLVKCRFGAITDPVGGWTGTSVSLCGHTVHRELRELYLKQYLGTSIGLFLDCFSFPNLSHLSLIDINSPSFFAGITSLLNRSSPLLTSLWIQEIKFEHPDLVNLLQAVPSLKRLIIYESERSTYDPAAHPLLLALAGVFSHHSLLPNLKTIHCHRAATYLAWDPTFWESVATLCEILSLHKIIEKRPLTSIIIGDGTRYGDRSKLCEDKNILLRLVEISQSGIDLKVLDVGGSNLLGCSLDKMKSCNAC